MRGSYLYAARAELHVGMLVADDEDGLADYGQNDVFADEVLVALIFGVDGDGGVAEHCFGTGGRNDEIFVAAFDLIFKVPEEGIFLAVDDFGVGERRSAVGAPVDYARTAVDETLVVEVDEHLPDRL